MVASLQKRELLTRRARTKDPFRASHLIDNVCEHSGTLSSVKRGHGGCRSAFQNREERTGLSLTDASSSSLLSPEALRRSAGNCTSVMAYAVQLINPKAPSGTRTSRIARGQPWYWN